MTDVVDRVGVADGLTAVGFPRVLRVGVLVGWTTAAASFLDPIHRPIGMMWVLLTAVAAGFGWIVEGARGAAVGAVAGFIGYFAVIMLMGMIIEPVLFSRAARVWLVDERGRRGCAKAVVLPDGAWCLTSVAAWPFGRGIGTELTEAVTADADGSRRAVQLIAENRRVGSLYERFGFVYTRRGGRVMRRDPIATG